MYNKHPMKICRYFLYSFPLHLKGFFHKSGFGVGLGYGNLIDDFEILNVFSEGAGIGIPYKKEHKNILDSPQRDKVPNEPERKIDPLL